MVEPPGSQEWVAPQMQQLWVRGKGAIAMRNSLPNLAILDAAGQEFELVGQAGEKPAAVPESALCLIYKPRDGQGEPSSLVLKGRRNVIIEVPFTLRNVPLP